MIKAFLIGAGATRAEYPKAPLSDDFFKILNSIDVKRRYFNAINQAIQPYIDVPLEELNIEKAMELSYNFPQSIQTSFLETLHFAIYELLAAQTESNIDYIKNYIRREITRPPTLFKTLLNDTRLHKNDFFLTLNYDLYLDREVIAVEGKINYGLDKDLINWHDDAVNLSQEQDFSVYHLHGSLNWEQIDHKVNVSLGAISPKYTRSGTNLCLIPPGKKELTPILKSIWDVARRRLLSASELIIIGCSLNPTDTELIKLVNKFVAKKGAKKVKVIYKSNITDAKVNDNYRAILGDQIKRFPYGFNLVGPDVRSGKHGALEFIFS